MTMTMTVERARAYGRRAARRHFAMDEMEREIGDLTAENLRPFLGAIFARMEPEEIAVLRDWIASAEFGADDEPDDGGRTDEEIARAANLAPAMDSARKLTPTLSGIVIGDDSHSDLARSSRRAGSSPDSAATRRATEVAPGLANIGIGAI